jgi:hypothetical protein
MSVCLDSLLVSVQDRCMVCTKRTIGSEIVLDAPEGTPGHKAQLEACFGLLGDVLILMQDRSMVCAERAISSKIVFDITNRTPR